MTLNRFSSFAALLFIAATAAPLAAQQDGLVAFPNVYKVQFENPYVRLIRVRLPGNAQLADHTHPPGIMLHVYFNDADPVQFNHDGPPNDITRPPVKARSYRVGRATPETHSVINTGAGMSDYMRIELKTVGDEGQRSRVPTPPLVNETSTTTEVTNSQYRSGRVTVASGQSLDVTAPASAPALLLALTEGVTVQVAGKPAHALPIGTEHFVDASGSATIRNTGSTPIQLLRVDFLTKPMN